MIRVVIDSSTQPSQENGMDTLNLNLRSIQTALPRMTPAALSLPEILSSIFKLLQHDRKTLLSAACVNQIWFHEAIRHLWAKTDLKALIAVETSRRAIYAPKICDLTIPSGHTNLNLEFQLLRILRFDCLFGPSDEGLSQYLRPTLEEIYLRHWPPISFLDGLNNYCPQLREFTQVGPQLGRRPGIVEFFSKNQTIRRIRLTLLPRDEPETIATILALSKVINLEGLMTIGEVPTEALAQFQESQHDGFDFSRSNVRKPFGLVHTVRIMIGVSALPFLSTAFSALTSLSLELAITNDDHALDALVDLPLRSLHLHVATGVRLSSQELLVLHNTKSLQHLMISPKPFNRRPRMPKFEISNDQFKQIFANLSRLETLLIWYALDVPDPNTALKDLGQSCPKLVNLRLYCPIDITAWCDIPKLLFPSLKFAWVSSVSDQNLLGETNETTAQMLAEILNRHAPELDRFVALDRYDFRPNVGDELSQLTMRAHGRIKETGQTKHAREENRGVANR